MQQIRNLVKSFFGYSPDGYEFKYFSISHIIPLLLLALTIILLYRFRDKIRNWKYEPNIRITLAALIITNEMMFVWDQVYLKIASVSNDMPLHLCGIAMYVSAFMLLLNSKKIFEILYFWIICGTINALISPAGVVLANHSDFGPMTFRYYQYFMGHSLLVFFIFYMIFISKYTINFKSFIKSMIALNIYGFTVLFIDFLIHGNYLYLMGPAEGGSPLDFFPPFPFNIVVLEILAFILFYLTYLPWYFINKRKYAN